MSKLNFKEFPKNKQEHEITSKTKASYSSDSCYGSLEDPKLCKDFSNLRVGKTKSTVSLPDTFKASDISNYWAKQRESSRSSNLGLNKATSVPSNLSFKSSESPFTFSPAYYEQGNANRGPILHNASFRNNHGDMGNVKNLASVPIKDDEQTQAYNVREPSHLSEHSSKSVSPKVSLYALGESHPLQPFSQTSTPRPSNGDNRQPTLIPFATPYTPNTPLSSSVPIEPSCPVQSRNAFLKRIQNTRDTSASTDNQSISDLKSNEDQSLFLDDSNPNEILNHDPGVIIIDQREPSATIEDSSKAGNAKEPDYQFDYYLVPDKDKEERDRKRDEFTRQLFSSITYQQSASAHPFSKYAMHRQPYFAERSSGTAFGPKTSTVGQTCFPSQDKYRKELMAKINEEKIMRISGQVQSNHSFAYKPAPLPLIKEVEKEHSHGTQKMNKPISPSLDRRTELFLKKKYLQIMHGQEKKQTLSPNAARRTEAFLQKKKAQKEDHCYKDESNDSYSDAIHKQLSGRSNRGFSSSKSVSVSLSQSRQLESEKRVERFLIKRAEKAKKYSQEISSMTLNPSTTKLFDEHATTQSKMSKLTNHLHDATTALSKLQLKQTEEHFNLDPDPDQVRLPIFEPINPFPYHFYGGKRPHLIQESPICLLKLISNTLANPSDVQNGDPVLPSQEIPLTVTTPSEGSLSLINDNQTCTHQTQNNAAAPAPIQTETAVCTSEQRILHLHGNIINLSTTDILSPNAEVFDEVMNGFLILSTRLAREQGRQVDCVSVNFLKHKGTITDSNQTEKQDYFRNELELDYVCDNITSLLIPFYSAGHWSLYHADFIDRTIEVIDSIYLSPERMKLKTDAFQEISKLLKTKFRTGDWTFLPRVSRIALQGNSTLDCGIFVLAQAFSKIHLNTWLFSFSQEDVRGFRVKVFKDLMQEYETKATLNNSIPAIPTASLNTSLPLHSVNQERRRLSESESDSEEENDVSLGTTTFASITPRIIFPSILDPKTINIDVNEGFMVREFLKENTPHISTQSIESAAHVVTEIEMLFPSDVCVLCKKYIRGNPHCLSLDPCKKAENFKQAELYDSLVFMQQSEHSSIFQYGNRICSSSCGPMIIKYTKNAKFIEDLKQQFEKRRQIRPASEGDQDSTLCSTCQIKLEPRKKSSLKTLVKNGNCSFGELMGEMKTIMKLDFNLPSVGFVCPPCKTIINRFGLASRVKKDLDCKLRAVLSHIYDVTAEKFPTTRKATQPTGITPVNKKSRRLVDEEVNKDPCNIDTGVNMQNAQVIAKTFESDLTSETRKKIEKEFDHLILSSGWKTDGTPTDDQISGFDFKTMQDFLRNNCPNICTMFSADSEGKVEIEPPQVMAVCILAYSKNRRFNLLQKILSLNLMGSTSKKQNDLLQTLGVCICRSTTYKTADELNQKNDRKLLKWKSNEEELWAKALGSSVDSALQTTLIQPSEALTNVSSTVSQDTGSRSNKRSSRNLDEEFEDISLQEEGSYSIQLDNIDYYLHARHQGIANANQLKNETVGFIVKSRIPNCYRSVGQFKQAQSLPDSVFLLTRQELNLLSLEKRHLLMAIACLHINACKSLVDSLPERKVEYETENSKKSQLIPTGLIFSNLSSLKGVMEVISKIEYLMPVVNGTKVATRIRGDGMTFNLLVRCKLLKSASIEHETFNHIYPSSASNRFHKSMIRMQRQFQIFDLEDRKSRTSIGSLSNIKLTQQHKTASAKTGDTYNHGFELTEATMHGLSILLLLKHLKIKSITSIPPPNIDPTNNMQVMAWLGLAAKKAVAEMEKNVIPSSDSMSTVCSVCNKQTEAEGSFCAVVACNEYVHLQCIKVVNPKLVFTVRVEVNKKTKSQRKVEGAFCSERHADSKYFYSLGLLHSTIDLKLRRDACRWNDADMMLLHNKADLQFFFNNGNHQYFKICLHLLLSQHDCTNPFIKFEEKFNSTINLQGKANRNLEFDRVQENLVKISKFEIKSHGGSPIASSLKRRTQLIGSMEPVNESLMRINCRLYNTKQHKPREFLLETVDFVDRYAKENLVEKVGIRSHDGLVGGKYTPLVNEEREVAFLEKVRKSLLEYDRNNDFASNFIHDVRRQRDYPEFCGLKQLTSWVVSNELAPNGLYFSSISHDFPLVHVPNDVQYEVAEQFSRGNDCMVVLPCSFGKSMCFIYAGLLKHMANRTEEITVNLIVSPLLAIISDQIKSLVNFSLTGIHLTVDNMEDVQIILSGLKVKPLREKLLFVFITPEFFRTPNSIKYLKALNINLLTIDEFHLVHSWGAEFRPCFDEIGKFRVDYKGPVLALSATVGTLAFKTAKLSLNIKTEEPETFFCLAVSDRPNVFVSLKKPSEKNKFMGKVAAGIKLYGKNYPKAVIYFESLADLNNAYISLMEVLKGAAYCGETNKTSTRMIQLFYANQGDDTKSFILSSFGRSDSSIRIVLATISYGLGVDLPDLRIVVYFQSQRIKKDPDVIQYMQCFGRCSRDGLPGVGIIFIKDLNTDKCIRKTLLQACVIEGEPMLEIQSVSDLQRACYNDCIDYCFCYLCLCCTYCASTCECNQSLSTDYLDFIIPTISEFADLEIHEDECEESNFVE